jgi:4-amino-4-deoxy-L-arabinose transferase-like glycosyltransferase
MFSEKRRLRAYSVLLVLCALIALARLHTYNEPFERDITTYAVIAHEMLQGRPLYSDMWDLKPPAIFVTYELGEVFGGYGPTSIYLLGVGAAIFTLLALYRAGVIFGGKRCGLWAGVLWTIVCSDLYLQANQPNTEVFINACLAWGFVAFLQLKPQKFDGRRILQLGVLLALASLYKQVALAVFLLLALAYVLRPEGEGEMRLLRRTAVLQVLTVLAFIATAWVGVVAYFMITGRWQALYDTLFVIGRFYAGNIWGNLANGLAPHRLCPSHLYFVLPLLSAGIAGCILGLRQGRNTRPWLLWSAYLIGTQIAVSLPGQFYSHYYQLWLPPLIIGASWGLALLSSIPHKISQFASLAAGTIVVAILAAYELPSFLVPANDWSRMKYGEVFVTEKLLAGELDEILKPNETFYEYGSEPGLYFYTKRRPVSGVIIAYPLYEGPLSARFSRRVTAALESASPDLIILAVQYPLSQHVANFINRHYRVMSDKPRFGMYFLLVRTHSALDKRLYASKNKPAAQNTINK